MVVGLGHYYHDGNFYRWHDNSWMISAHVSGPWLIVPDYRVPRKLFKSKSRFKPKQKLKGKGKFKARRYW